MATPGLLAGIREDASRPGWLGAGSHPVLLLLARLGPASPRGARPRSGSSRPPSCPARGGGEVVPAALVRPGAHAQPRWSPSAGCSAGSARGGADVPARAPHGRLHQDQGRVHAALGLRRLPADPHAGAADAEPVRHRGEAEADLPGAGLLDLPAAADRGGGGRRGRHLPQDRLHAGRQPGAGGEQGAPARWPGREIYRALRLGFGVGWSYILLAEMVDIGKGLGGLIIVSQRRGPREHIYLSCRHRARGVSHRQAVGRGRERLFPYREGQA